jgi:hypothetical protein
MQDGSPMTHSKSASMILQRFRPCVALAALGTALLPGYAPFASMAPPEGASMLLFAAGVFGLAASVRRAPFVKG